MVRILFPIFATFILICPIASVDGGNVSDRNYDFGENEEKLVDHIRIRAYSDPILLQLLGIRWGMVSFGEIDLYDLVDEEPITVHVNLSVVWWDNETIPSSTWSHKCKLSRNIGGWGTNIIAFTNDVYKKVKTPVGFYTIRVDLHVEEDNSSKVVEIPGVMFYYICMLSTGPFLFTYMKDILTGLILEWFHRTK